MQNAYVAGLIDGEGYLGLMMRHKELTDRKRVDYLPVIKVTMTYEPVIELLKNKYGGWKNNRVFSGKNSKEAFTWVLAGKKIEKALKDIYPYLIVKKKQADILFKRLKSYDRKKLGKNKSTYSDADFAKIEELYRQIKVLNHRGIQ